MIFRLSIFVAILSFGRPLTSQSIKCLSLNNEPCMTRPTLIHLNSHEYVMDRVTIE